MAMAAPEPDPSSNSNNLLREYTAVARSRLAIITSRKNFIQEVKRARDELEKAESGASKEKEEVERHKAALQKFKEKVDKEKVCRRIAEKKERALFKSENSYNDKLRDLRDDLEKAGVCVVNDLEDIETVKELVQLKILCDFKAGNAAVKEKMVMEELPMVQEDAAVVEDAANAVGGDAA